MPHLLEDLTEHIRTPFQDASDSTLEYLTQRTDQDLEIARDNVRKRLTKKDYHYLEEQELLHISTLLEYRLVLGEFPQMLDSSFLRQGIKVDTRYQPLPNITVPKFTVHRIYDSPNRRIIGPRRKHSNTQFLATLDYNNKWGGERRLNPVMNFPLPDKMPAQFLSEYDIFQSSEVNTKSIEQCARIRFDARFNLSLILPETTKQKIQQALTVFETDQIYIIPETRPEQWSVNYEVGIGPSEPLIVGVKNNRTYLIDCFDTTPAEEYIRREFATKPRTSDLS
nr:hypothetical protein [Nanoarchaeum sp.]